ncbi:hypothetical protein [Mesonia sp.]|uniref:hypothetical protein n=1 Tax=Mesonia sp. TaxID=1960830 RepID=UPI003F94BA37
MIHEINQEKTTKPYKLNQAQNLVVEEARTQIENGDHLANEHVEQEIEDWLN